MYIYENPNWPRFTWDREKVSQALQPVVFQQGRLLGKMENLGFRLQEEALLKTLTNEAIKTSEIEGEVLKRDEVRSSVARHLGMDIGGLLPAARHVDGIPFAVRTGACGLVSTIGGKALSSDAP